MVLLLPVLHDHRILDLMWFWPPMKYQHTDRIMQLRTGARCAGSPSSEIPAPFVRLPTPTLYSLLIKQFSTRGSHRTVYEILITMIAAHHILYGSLAEFCPYLLITGDIPPH